MPFLFGMAGGRPGGARPGSGGGDGGLVVGVDDACAGRAAERAPARCGDARLASRWRAAGDAQRERAHRAGRAALGWAAARAVYVYVCAPSVRSAQWSARGPESGKQLARPHGCRTSCFMCVSSVLLAEMNIFYYRRARV